MKKKIYFIYWARSDFSIIRNIINSFKAHGFIVIEQELCHSKQIDLFRSLGINVNNSSVINIVYLFTVFFVLNIKSLFYKNIFVLGPNAVYSVLISIVLKKNILIHYNELPSFIEKGFTNLKSKIDFFLFNKIKNIIVSNKHRLKLFEKLATTKNHKYFVLDNILDLTKNHIYEGKRDIRDVEKINLMYTGVLNSNRMIEKLIETIGNSTRFNLIIAGFTDDRESLMKLIQNFNNIEFKGALPQADVLSLIQSRCDYGIAFYNMDSLNNKYCAPLKIHEYFRFNKLVISFKNSPLVEIENDFGIIYTINNIDELLSDLEFLKIERRLLNIKNDSFEIFRQKENDKFSSEMNNIIKLFNSDQNFN